MKIVYKGKTQTGKKIVVRYPERSDLGKMLNYINILSDERTFITYQGEHETLKSEKKYLEGRLKAIKDKKAVQLLVFYKDQLIGVSDIHLLDKTQKHIGIFGITISKDFRNDGIGKVLMNLIEDEGKKKLPGLKIITLEVFSTNSIARDLYKKMRFKEYGVLPKGIIRNNKVEDSVLMYKLV